MKNLLLPLFVLLLLGSATSCKKSCYTCNQYCSYCVNKSDSSIIYKVCTSNLHDELRIDSIESTFSDTAWICNILNNTGANAVNVCDGPNNIDQALTYYEEEDYFCTPQ